MGAYESPYAPIDASAGPGGQIAPSGRIGVLVSNDQAFAIAADPYRAVIQDVRVDGASIGAADGYTFLSVTSNHTIQAFFLAYPDTNGCRFGTAAYDPAGGFILGWPALNGWRYTLQKTPTLTPADWADVPPYIDMSGLGLMVISNDLDSAASMFYRLRFAPGD
jgi:hypothetical protein